MEQLGCFAVLSKLNKDCWRTKSCPGTIEAEKVKSKPDRTRRSVELRKRSTKIGRLRQRKAESRTPGRRQRQRKESRI